MLALKKNAKRNPFKSLFIPNRIVADMNYPNYSISESRELNPVRFELFRLEQSSKQFVLVVIALKNSLSPMQYSWETFSLITNFLECFDIGLSEVEIVLDYEQYNGDSIESYIKWEFKTDRKGNYLADNLLNIDKNLIELIQFNREIRNRKRRG